LLFAFDEIVALGYRENVNLAQIRTFTDMESHEEKVYKAMRETQEKEAKQRMLEKAEEIRRSKIADKSHKSSSQYSGGFGSSSMMSNSSSYNNMSSSSSQSYAMDSHEPSIPSYSASSSSSAASKSNRAMKLGTNKDVLPAFIEQQVKQSLPQSVQQSATSNQAITPSGQSVEK
jgi:hypothetical protein